MKIIHFVAVLSFLLVAQLCSAQSYMIDSAGNKVKVDPKIVHSKPPETEEVKKVVHNDNNVVKVGLLYFISGCEPVFYERRILPYLSVQAGIGLTTRDFVADLVNGYLNAA